MKVAVIRFSSLGDCVLLCPMLVALGRCGASEVTVVTKSAYAELFACVEGVDRVSSLPPGAGIAELRSMGAALRRSGDVVIDAHNSWRSRVVSSAAGGAAARFDKCYGRRLRLILLKKASAFETILQQYRRTAVAAGFELPPLAPGALQVPHTLSKRAAELLGDGGRWIAMAPGSRWPAKQWATERYAELAERLAAELGVRVALVGDGSECRATASIAAQLGGGAVDLGGRCTIMETAAVISRCVAFVGNDSGLMHLSEAMGVPVTAVFGPTVEALGYFPSLPHSRVVERPLPCRPCSRNGARPCVRGDNACMQIPVDLVAQALREGIDGNAARRRYTVVES